MDKEIKLLVTAQPMAVHSGLWANPTMVLVSDISLRSDAGGASSGPGATSATGVWGQMSRTIELWI